MQTFADYIDAQSAPHYRCDVPDLLWPFAKFDGFAVSARMRAEVSREFIRRHVRHAAVWQVIDEGAAAIADALKTAVCTPRYIEGALIQAEHLATAGLSDGRARRLAWACAAPLVAARDCLHIAAAARRNPALAVALADARGRLSLFIDPAPGATAWPTAIASALVPTRYAGQRDLIAKAAGRTALQTDRTVGAAAERAANRIAAVSGGIHFG